MNRILQCLFAIGLCLVGYGVYLMGQQKPVMSLLPVSVSPPVHEPVSRPLASAPLSKTPPFEKGRLGGISPQRQIPPHPPLSKGGAHLKTPTPISKAAVPPPAVPKSLPDQFNPDLLKTLPKPVAVPTDVALPEVVSESGQWIGNQSGILQPTQVVFRNLESWRSFWLQAIAPYTGALAQVPDVDFSKEMVVGVFMGEEPLPGYNIRIVSTGFETPESERPWVVRYKSSDRFLGIFATRFAVQPFHLLKVPLFAGKIEFIEVKAK